LSHEGSTDPVTANDHDGGDHEGRPTAESSDQSTVPLEDPVASRATLARRLRAVERAMAGTEGVEFEPAADRAVDAGDLAALEDRLDALGRAVRAVGECLVTRERARRRDEEIESVRRAVEALPDGGAWIDGKPTDSTDGIEGVRPPDVGGSFDSEENAESSSGTGERESPTEWLDRVASGGVTPPSVE
jgi:hypothetical protein